MAVKNKYPIPLIAYLFDQLSRARWFTKLNLCFDYYHVQIVEEDVPKVASVTHYGNYKFLLMSFVLTNVPSTLCTCINVALQSFLD